MLDTKKEIEIRAEALYQKFRQDLNNLYNIAKRHPSLNSIGMEQIPIFELKAIVHDVASAEVKDFLVKWPQGIGARTRKREVVKYRQVFCFIGKRMGFILREIGEHSACDHAGVLYHSEKMLDYFETEDVEMTNLFNTVRNECEKRLKYKRASKHTKQARSNTESAVPAVLNQGVSQPSQD